MSRAKLLHCNKNVKHRGPRIIAPLLIVAMLAGCGLFQDDDPPPAEGDGGYPNLSTVPERPDAEAFEDAAMVEAGLRADRENASYDEAPLASSTAAGIAPPPPSTVAPAPTYDAAATESVITAGEPVAVPAAPTADAGPPPVAAPLAVAVVTSDGSAAPETVESYSIDTPADPQIASLPPDPVQVETRSTAVVPEPTAFGAPPPAQTGYLPQTVYPPQTAYPPAAPGQAASVTVNPSPLSRNLAAGSALPASVVYFADGSASIASAEVGKIYLVAQALAGRGGYVRVVGHSSMRTGNMNMERRNQANLVVSWARANSVADILLGYGVPATAMMVSGVSDTQPIYLENMPAGEAGNRRVEIYLE